jgi:hypothetical protein
VILRFGNFHFPNILVCRGARTRHVRPAGR